MILNNISFLYFFQRWITFYEVFSYHKSFIFFKIRGAILSLSQISVIQIVNSYLLFKKYDEIEINVLLIFVFLLLMSNLFPNLFFKGNKYAYKYS